MGQSAYPSFDTFEIVQVGVTNISSAGPTNNWVTIPHHLGYAPEVSAILNNVGLSGVFTVGNIPLPMYLSASTSGGQVIFSSWLFASVDATNVYIVLINATGSPISSFPIKYTLLRERAN